MKIQPIFPVIFLQLLTACSPAAVDAIRRAPSGAPSDEEVASVSRQQALDHVSNKTRVILSFSHGVQINYTSADGTSNLWYPGNSKIVKGEWKIEERPLLIRHRSQFTKKFDICFRYGRNTYNPATREIGGNWSCSSAHLRISETSEVVIGDVFGLQKREEVPFVLTRDVRTVSDAKAKLGKSQ